MLEAMNRKHRADDYRRIVDRLRAARPDIALTSDFIVGFPGEGDADFEETMQLVRDVGFATAFSFKYSRRPGTPAAALRGQVAEDVKSARLQELQALLANRQHEFDDSQIGRILPVLFEKPGRRDGQLVGRTPYLQPVHVNAPATMIGRLASVRIERRTANSLHGTLV
jgi:tRNA-2-methylthio-N6-dimethylallyladenosine synthase